MKAPRSKLPGSRMLVGGNTPPQGFALVATISILVLLALVAIGLLSLSTVTLRETTAGKAEAEARANARLAFHLALAELQKTTGDDRRITADASLVSTETNSPVVGVWESWSPDMTARPSDRAPDYEDEKDKRFVRWLVSGKRDELSVLEWARQGTPSSESVDLFTEAADGFDLAGSLIRLQDANRSGALAWAISQEATKAKLSVAGPELASRVKNDDLQAQPRPSLALIDTLGSPDGDWNQRAARLLDFNQVALDSDIWNGADSVSSGAHFTAVGAGLLTNVVEGGLKTDLSLGFEMSDSDFESESWQSGADTIPNPFHHANEDDYRVARGYRPQRPLYRPLSGTGTYQVKNDFWPANVHHFFPVTSVPTFHSLRSFYRLPYHLYRSEGDLTVFEREHDHVAGSPGRAARGYFDPPPAGYRGERTQMGIRPVMDRVMYLISGGLSDSDELRLVITPVITLWNPYNVALDIEGAVAHIWIDIPYEITWNTFNAGGSQLSNDRMYVSGLMGYQFTREQHGRSVNPYFYAALTASGDPLSGSGDEPIHFEPGEVRVFAPARQSLKEFDVGASIRERTVFLRPVDSLNQFTTEGGLSVPTFNTYRNRGFKRVLKKGEAAQMTFASVPREDYPFYISLEDATRAKGSNPTHEDRGQAIADVLANNFSRSGETVVFKSPRVPYATLKSAPVPVGVLESFHRVARGSDSIQPSDLVFTGNPRQPWMNPFVTNTSFQTGPQYEIRMRQVSSFNGVLQTADGGRTAYYGATQTPIGGRTHLSFFEIPSAPLLSLAGFQHCDLSPTPFSPANQFGNSWASAYVPREKVSDGALNVDHSYLINEALWDDYFFSGAAPSLTHSQRNGSPEVWDGETATVARKLSTVLEDFARDPLTSPLRNPRMKPVSPISDPDDWSARMLQPAACRTIAADLFVDGAFNINSTSVEAWKAVLSGLRDASFDVRGRETSVTGVTPFPRFRDPVGDENDNWHGFRTLGDQEIDSLARELVSEIRERGPFLSLGEFVNRRISDDELGLRGALQAAIDKAGLNQGALQDNFATRKYNRSSRDNISPNNTGVGIPGYLTQADVLKPLAPVITARSDTFTIRAYGDSRDATGKVRARVRVEAVVQRYPEFLEPSDPAYRPLDELTPINESFGRRFKVLSYRVVPEKELAG